MGLQSNEIDLIDAFLRGELSGAELDSFNTLLKSNPEFKEEFSQKQSLQNALRKQGNRDIKSLLQQQERRTIKRKSPKEQPVFKWISMAASVLIFAGILSFFIKPNSDAHLSNLYTDNFTAYPNDYQVIVRGENETDEISKIFNYYENKEYQKAISSIDARIKSTGKVDNKLSFFKAVSLMGLKENQKALEVLNKLKETDLQGYDNQIAWYSALNNIALKKVDQAKLELNAIVSSQSNFRKSSAQELLESLEE